MRVGWPALAVLFSIASADATEISVPSGFRIEVFAEGLGGARGLAVSPDGTVLVSLPWKGRVVALATRPGLARAAQVRTVAADLDLPHGLAFRRGHLYVGETGRVVRYRYDPATMTGSDRAVVVAGLPHSGHHWTRSIAFGPDDRLYVAIGSSCDICQERDPRRAAIVRYHADGSGEEIFATGLRNPVGFAFHPTTGALWTTVNERDWPGGGAPPDYVTELRRGAAYGWPDCYAERRRFFPDPTFRGTRGCDAMTLPSVELPAHAAPLGLTAYAGAQFPSEYVGDLFVALHGSRPGLPAAGHGVARVRVREQPPLLEPFSTGWRQGDRVIGRPVDIAVGRDGSLYVSDDHGDRVYRVTYRR